MYAHSIGLVICMHTLQGWLYVCILYRVSHMYADSIGLVICMHTL